jgi:hypothetical protein
MRETVERGESLLRAAVAAGVFTPVALQMIVVGEESGSLDDMMDEVADPLSARGRGGTEDAVGADRADPDRGLGVLVLILALGVFLPIWDLGQAAPQGLGRTALAGGGRGAGSDRRCRPEAAYALRMVLILGMECAFISTRARSRP